jgi:hypothetical protein
MVYQHNISLQTEDFTRVEKHHRGWEGDPSLTESNKKMTVDDRTAGTMGHMFKGPQDTSILQLCIPESNANSLHALIKAYTITPLKSPADGVTGTITSVRKMQVSPISWSAAAMPSKPTLACICSPHCIKVGTKHEKRTKENEHPAKPAKLVLG